jgi:hypothetical protein
MVKVEAIQEVKPESASAVRISLFSRGSDIVTFKLYRRIASEPKRLWHISDFSDIGSQIVVRRRLKELIKKGVVVRLRTYPAFYKLKSRE